MDNEQPKLPADNQRPRPVLHLELDLDTLVLAISGNVPHNAVGLDMARRLVDEFTARCENDRRAAGARAIVGPGGRALPFVGRG